MEMNVFFFNVEIIILFHSVSLEVLEDGTTPKSPIDSMNDGLPKLYIHSSAFIKVLGATVDLEVTNDGNILLKLYDKEGNVIDPNA